MRARWIKLFITIAIVLTADFLLKTWVVNTLPLGRSVQPIPALAPYFQLTYSQNTGAAFGFLPQAGDLFMVIGPIVVIAMLYFFPHVPEDGVLTRFAIGLICGGALGNATDRLRFGFVVDFIHYQIPPLISNVSNLADHAIVLGVILIFVESWLLDRHKAAQAEAVALESDTHDEV